MKNTRGFTLIELIIAVALLLVVLIPVYNIFFFGLFAYETISEDSLSAMEIQPAILYIERDIRQARKPNDESDSINYVDTDEIMVYTDVDKDGRPEEIRYIVSDGALIRSYRKSGDDEYPYSFTGSFTNEKTLIRNIVNSDIFSEPEAVVEEDPNNPYRPSDYRRKIKIVIEIENPNARGGNLEIEKYLMSRSRVEAD